MILITLQYMLLRRDAGVYKTGISAIYIILIIVLGMFLGIIMLQNEKHRYEVYSLIITVYSILALSLNSVMVARTLTDNDITMCNIAMGARDKDNGEPFIRMKNLSVALTHNYPLVMGINAASNYLAVDSYHQLSGFTKIGYAKVGDRMSDYGGTLFTDALLGIDEVISCEAVNEKLYKYENTYKNYSVYKNIYQYDLGILIKNKNKLPDNAVDMVVDPFTYQNILAKQLLGEEILKTGMASGNEINVTINDESVLYIYSEQADGFESVTVHNVCTGDEHIYELSKSGWMNGILELGVYKDAVIQIQVQSRKDAGKISYALLPLKHFRETVPVYCDNYKMTVCGNSLNISLTGADSGDCLYIPAYHDNGWRAKVDGQRVQIEEFADYFMAIPLREGINEIKLSFTPTGFWLGVIVSLFGVLFLVITWKFPIAGKRERLNNGILFLDRVLFAILMLLFYVIPVLFLIKRIFQVIL